MKPVVFVVTIVHVLEGVIGVTPGTCPPGFVQCTNGACEPYTALCGQFTPKPSPTTSSIVPRSTRLSSTGHETSTPTPTEVTSMTSTTTEGTLSPITDVTAVTFSFASTIYSGAVSGTCPQGFVQCTDGRCEPYDSMCGQFTPNPPPTTTTIVASSTTGTSPTEWTLSSMNTDEMTVTPPFISSTYSGPETCPSGFETCSDGKCEPFHFLCEEHQLGIPAISIVG